MGAETNNASQETESERTIVEVNDEMNRYADWQVKEISDSKEDVVMSARQSHEFMSTVMKGSDDPDARIRSENTKLSENIKAVTDEMSVEIQIANKILSGSLTKQFREEKASLKEELSNRGQKF